MSYRYNGFRSLEEFWRACKAEHCRVELQRCRLVEPRFAAMPRGAEAYETHAHSYYDGQLIGNKLADIREDAPETLILARRSSPTSYGTFYSFDFFSSDLEKLYACGSSTYSAASGDAMMRALGYEQIEEPVEWLTAEEKTARAQAVGCQQCMEGFT